MKWLLLMALVVMGCGLALGLDGYHNCQGSECDRSIDAATTDAAPWAPSAFGSDLFLWLDAAEATAGVAVPDGGPAALVSSGRDKSVNRFTFLPSPSPGTGPEFASGAINMLPAVRFVRPTDVLSTLDDPVLQLGAGDPFVIEAVVMVKSYNKAPVSLFNKAVTSVSGPAFGPGLVFAVGGEGVGPEGYFSGRIGTSPNPIAEVLSPPNPVLDQRPHLIGFRRLGINSTDLRSSMDLTLDGTSVVSGPANVDAVDVSLVGQPVRMGRVQTADDNFGPCDVYLAELIGVRRATPIADAEVAQLEAYLRAKYATP